MQKHNPPKKDLTLQFAEAGLKGDKETIVKLLEELAVRNIKTNRHTSYNGALNLIEKYSDKMFSDVSSSTLLTQSYNGFDAENVWLSPDIELKVKKFIKLQKKIPHYYVTNNFNKLLLYGPSGSGKTTIGFFIAHKLGKPINYIKITDVISSKLGETMHNIANIFRDINEEVIFIDEFDAFAKNRNDGNDVGELKRIVNSIIQTLDFQSENKIIIVATNLLELIDPAIIRRFKFRILIDELTSEEKKNFFDFLINRKRIKKGQVQLTSDEKSFLVEVFDAIEINTVDAITDFFDKTIINSLIRNKKRVALNDFVQTLFVDDYLKKPKMLRKRDKKILSRLCKIMEDLGYPKVKIAKILDIHRNSYKNYAK